MLMQTIPINGQPCHLDNGMLLVKTGDVRDSYNLQWYRPGIEPVWEVRRHAPDKQETRDNLLQLAKIAKTHRTRDVYTKQYLGEARRAMARKGVLNPC